MHETRSTKPQLICGVDEAGRGPLAGPVTAAAVILPPDFPADQLRDSKKLTLAGRTRLESLIRQEATAFGMGWAWPAEIDRINILQAAMLAMQRAVYDLRPPQEHPRLDTAALLQEPTPPLDTIPPGPDTGRSQPGIRPDLALIDGNRCPDLGDIPCQAEIKGDDRIHQIMAASILAKTARD